MLPRENAAMLRHNDAGGLLQIAHAGIIAKALPQLCQAIFLAGRKRGDIGQLRQKAHVIPLHGLHARLLKHDLRQPDVIRLAILPPRQRTVPRRIPAEQPPGKRIWKLHCSHSLL